LVRTGDGGTTWQRITLPDGFEAREAEFADAGRRGWLLADRCVSEPNPPFCSEVERALLATDDGGRTWRRTADAPPVVRHLTAIDRENQWGLGLTGACYQDSTTCRATVVQSDDGGRSWQTVLEAAPGPSSFIIPFEVIDARAAYAGVGRCAAACTVQLKRTTDGGVSWVDVGPPRETIGGDLACLDVQRCTTVGGWTDDGGSTFHAAALPTSAGSGAFDFVDESHGWYAASKLLRTTDGGATWAPVADVRLSDVEFTSRTDGYGVDFTCGLGECDGAIVRTTDGGATWSDALAFPDAGNIPDIALAEGHTAIVTLEHATQGFLVMRSDDAGATWRTLVRPPGTALSFESASLIWAATADCDGQTGLCTLGAHVSTNGGERWSKAGEITGVEEGCGPSIEAFGTRHIWISYANCRNFVEPVDYRSSDGGRTWERIERGWVGEPGRLWFFDERTGRSFGTRCDAPGTADGGCRDVLFRTNDGGRTWTEEALSPKARNFGRNTLFLGPERFWHGDQSGGGVVSVLSAALWRYRGDVAAVPAPRPPVIGPETGSGGLAVTRP
jgi:photosystem II stability/assembly factor-like uncharacterized protein